MSRARVAPPPTPTLSLYLSLPLPSTTGPAHVTSHATSRLAPPDTQALVSASVTAAGGSAAPPAPPLSPEDLAALVGFVASASRLVVLTGAGASTESGVPDYRSPGG